ncbi:MAG: hypothetical protein HQ522_15215 [Bacteroidetes bacterium]|nr:hypothetical protein [Bacteroidota bacterium]
MLNIGIIGITEVLEPHVKRIQKNKNVNVIGKASVGTSTQINSFHFSIPEFNRVELVERADVLLVDNSSRLPYDMLCDIIKRGKHIFTTEYLDLTIDECSQLAKLANESRSVVQVSNPFCFTPAIQWLSNNFKAPLLLDISKFSNYEDQRKTLYSMLLMLIGITGISPKKIGVTAFESVEKKTTFSNVRLEFGNASVVNLNFGSQISQDKFKIKGYSKNKFVVFNLNKETYSFNNETLDLSGYSVENEFDSFVDAIQNNSHKNSRLEDYLAATILFKLINKKIVQHID